MLTGPFVCYKDVSLGYSRDSLRATLDQDQLGEVGRDGLGMDARIQVVGDRDDLTALRAWLAGEAALRGRVRVVREPIRDTELGSVSDMLTVALGAGGVGATLASSLKTWLASRRSTVKVTVESAGRTVTIDIDTIGQAGPVLQQILSAEDDG